MDDKEVHYLYFESKSYDFIDLQYSCSDERKA